MIILAGIDDTDTLTTPGTNKLALSIASRLPGGFRCEAILRHQLFFDPRVPFTSHNGSASLRIRSSVPGGGAEALASHLRKEMLDWFVEGSDPGLCVAEAPVPEAVQEYAWRCKGDVVRQGEARGLARSLGIRLEGLGGTEDGVIGALAAVGLAATGQDGRVIHLEGWDLAQPLTGEVEVEDILARGVDEVRERASGRVLAAGRVLLDRKLRPNLVESGKVVLFVESREAPGSWKALKVV